MSRRMYRHTRRPASRVVQTESRSRKLVQQNQWRLMFVVAVFAFSFIALSLRLIEVGTVGGGELPFKRLVAEPSLLLKAQERGQDVSALAAHEAPRRAIVDRNGMLLATNIKAAALAANPTLIREPAEVAKRLSRVLSDVDEASLLQKLSRENSKFIYIKRSLTPKEQASVNALGIPGLFFEQGRRRVYPFGDLASHVVGYSNVDGRGIAGIEKQFDRSLHYTTGDDESLALSIDMRVQSLVQQALARQMEEFKAVAGSAVVMDARSGELLSLVSLPSFDPHEPADATQDQLFNRASLGVYELGSSFKTFTVAAALDAGIVGLRDGYDASSPIRAAGFTINDSHPYYRWLSVPEIYAYSSNIGTVKMIKDVGIARQQAFLKKLGMMEPVGVELPERAQPLVPSDWRELNMMTISYGHGISVTPLHLVQAIAAMVNGGVTVKPTLVKHDSQGEPVEGQRVIAAKTSGHIRTLMRQVVEYGTARKAQVAGYPIGGKTGTAEKIKNGRYKDKDKLVSFVGAFPIDDPRYIVFVMLDEPKGNRSTYGYATGGWIAAPVVAEIVAQMGPLLGIAPQPELDNETEKQFWVEAAKRNKYARQRHFQMRNVHAAAY